MTHAFINVINAIDDMPFSQEKRRMRVSTIDIIMIN